MKKFVPIFLIMIISGMSVSCFEKLHHEEEKPLIEDFSFVSTVRPRPMSVGFNYNLLNSVMIEEAIKKGQDSVLQFQKDADRKKPFFSNLEFFPIISNKELRYLTGLDHPGRKSTLQASEIPNIDFNTQFAFVVARPTSSPTSLRKESGTSAATNDKLFIKEEQNNSLFLDCQSSVISNGPRGTRAMYLKWNVKVFVFDKKDYKELVIFLSDNEYHFNLIPSDEATL